MSFPAISSSDELGPFEFDPFRLNNPSIDIRVPQLDHSSSGRDDSTKSILKAKRQANNATIGMELQTRSFVRRGDMAEGRFHTKQNDKNGSYLKKYQVALVTEKKVSSFEENRNRWERASTASNGHVRRQKMAFDARTYQGRAAHKKGTALVGRDLVPWPVHTNKDTANIPPSTPSSPSRSTTSWAAISEFDDTDSALFSPSIADTSSLVSDTDDLSSAGTLTTADFGWCGDDINIFGHPGATKASNLAEAPPVAECSPSRHELVTHSNSSCADRAVVKTERSYEGTAATFQAKSNDLLPDHSETHDITSLILLRRRRINSTRRGPSSPLEQESSDSNTDDRQSESPLPVPPEFLIMKEKLKKVHSEQQLSASTNKYPTQQLNRPRSKLQGKKADRVSACSSPNYQSPSFDDLSRNGTDVTAPDSFDDADREVSICADEDKREDKTNNLRPISDAGLSKISALFLRKAAMVEDQRKRGPPRAVPMAKASLQEAPMQDDPRYAKYFRMLKLGIPRAAVVHACQRDNVDPCILDDGRTTASSNDEKQTKITQQDTHRRTRLHWEELQCVGKDSVWAMLDRDNEFEDELKIDDDEFAALFQKEKETSSSNKRLGEDSHNGAVKLIDQKRANNGGIVLAKLKRPYHEVATDIDELNELDLEPAIIQAIAEYIPSEKEEIALRPYLREGEASAGLSECERWMAAVMSVDSPKEKLKALKFEKECPCMLQGLQSDASILEEACIEVGESVRLRKLLGIILALGNRLNTSGEGRKDKAAAGLYLESLESLNQAKAFDKEKTTFLQYVVRVVERSKPDLLDHLQDDLKCTLKAERLSYDQWQQQLSDVEDHIENVRSLALRHARRSLSNGNRLYNDEEYLLITTRVGLFVLRTLEDLSQLKETQERLKKSFNELMHYFAIEKEGSVSHDVLRTIAAFVRSVDRARANVTCEVEMNKGRNPQKRTTRGPKLDQLLKQSMTCNICFP